MLVVASIYRTEPLEFSPLRCGGPGGLTTGSLLPLNSRTMPDPARRTTWETLRRYLLRGFLVWIPLAAVVLVGRIIYSLVSSWFFPSLGWEPRLTALGVVASVLLLTGWVVTRFGVAGRILKVAVERPLSRVPVARWVYSGVRELLEALFTSGDAFGKVVLIEYPRRGVYSIAFQMAGDLGEVQHRVRQRVQGGVRVENPEPSAHHPSTAPATPGDGSASPEESTEREVMAVFVPTTPNPTSGFVITLPREEVIELSMSRQQALQMVISLGVVVPRWENGGAATASSTASPLAHPPDGPPA